MLVVEANHMFPCILCFNWISWWSPLQASKKKDPGSRGVMPVLLCSFEYRTKVPNTHIRFRWTSCRGTTHQTPITDRGRPNLMMSFWGTVTFVDAHIAKPVWNWVWYFSRLVQLGVSFYPMNSASGVGSLFPFAAMRMNPGRLGLPTTCRVAAGTTVRSTQWRGRYGGVFIPNRLVTTQMGWGMMFWYFLAILFPGFVFYI